MKKVLFCVMVVCFLAGCSNVITSCIDGYTFVHYKKGVDFIPHPTYVENADGSKRYLTCTN